MARPIKKNADYFPHSANFHGSKEGLAVLSKFGAEGYGILFFIYEQITNSNFNEGVEIEEIDIITFSGHLRVSEEKFKEVLSFLCRIKLLQKDNDTYSSKIISEELKSLSDYREKRRERSERVMHVQNQVMNVQNQVTTDQKGGFSTKESIVENSIEEDRKEKERKEENLSERDAGESKFFNSSFFSEKVESSNETENNSTSKQDSNSEVILPSYEEFRNNWHNRVPDKTSAIVYEIAAKHGGVFDDRSLYDIYTSVKKDLTLEGRFCAFFKKYSTGELTKMPAPSRLLKVVKEHKFDNKAFNPTATTSMTSTIPSTPKRGFDD